VSRYIPEFQGKWKDAVTVSRLLTHSSGLPAWRPLYKEAESPAAALALAIATPLDTMPGTRMVYSDLGVIIAGDIVARVTGQPLDAFLKARVFGPLSMWDTQYNPDRSLRARIAPTEVDPWRQRHLRGEVHDENAFALGGVSGHAGLFSTGYDLMKLARNVPRGRRHRDVEERPPARLCRSNSLCVTRDDTAVHDRAGFRALESRPRLGDA
jgi:CubicO group peptidase (beta-lactamase class C family)